MTEKVLLERHPFDPTEDSLPAVQYADSSDTGHSFSLLTVLPEVDRSDWAVETALAVVRSRSDFSRNGVLVDLSFGQPTQFPSSNGDTNGEGLADHLLYGVSISRIVGELPESEIRVVEAGPGVGVGPQLLRHSGLETFFAELIQDGPVVAFLPMGGLGPVPLMSWASEVFVLAGTEEHVPRFLELQIEAGGTLLIPRADAPEDSSIAEDDLTVRLDEHDEDVPVAPPISAESSSVDGLNVDNDGPASGLGTANVDRSELLRSSVSEEEVRPANSLESSKIDEEAFPLTRQDQSSGARVRSPKPNPADGLLALDRSTTKSPLVRVGWAVGSVLLVSAVLLVLMAAQILPTPTWLPRFVSDGVSSIARLFGWSAAP